MWKKWRNIVTILQNAWLIFLRVIHSTRPLRLMYLLPLHLSSSYFILLFRCLSLYEPLSKPANPPLHLICFNLRINPSFALTSNSPLYIQVQLTSLTLLFFKLPVHRPAFTDPLTLTYHRRPLGRAWSGHHLVLFVGLRTSFLSRKKDQGS